MTTSYQKMIQAYEALSQQNVDNALKQIDCFFDKGPEAIQQWACGVTVDPYWRVFYTPGLNTLEQEAIKKKLLSEGWGHVAFCPTTENVNGNDNSIIIQIYRFNQEDSQNVG